MRRQELLFLLEQAFWLARKHKSTKAYVKRFEENLQSNLLSLCNDLYDRTYKAMPSTCFIITEPKKREIFAAAFRDRIVHHLYFELTHEMFEKTFIYDTYSCIKDRGTHFGIARLDHHIRSCSENYTKKCYVLKLDIKGYFMSIDRILLLGIAKESLKKHGCNDNFILWLTDEIIQLDPTQRCNVLATKKEYEDLPDSKTLFKSKRNCGLPIGNLTSQLFSNVYLNVFDQWMKREMRCNHYWRYVDDAYVVSCDKEWLKSLKEKAGAFLRDRLHLELHQGKSHIVDATKGVEFLGAFVKPHRIYISNPSLRRMKKSTFDGNVHKILASTSRYGVLGHYKSYNIRKKLFYEDRL